MFEAHYNKSLFSKEFYFDGLSKIFSAYFFCVVEHATALVKVYEDNAANVRLELIKKSLRC